MSPDDAIQVIRDWSPIQASLDAETGVFPLSELYLTYLKYRPREELENPVNSSMLALFQGSPVALILSISSNPSDIRFIDQPAVIEFNKQCNNNQNLRRIAEEALARAISQLPDLSGSLELECGSKNLGPLETACLDRGATPSHIYRGYIPLQLTEEEILAGMRSSHRRHIRKSSEFLSRIEVSFGSVEESIFEGFRELYLYEAKQTYSESRWMGMREALLCKEAFLVSSYVEKELVGATFCWVSPKLSSYGTGVYARTYFSQAPISHFPMFRSILFAREIGMERFYIGEVYAPGKDPKQRNIAFFKRGFLDAVNKSLVFDF